MVNINNISREGINTIVINYLKGLEYIGAIASYCQPSIDSINLVGNRVIVKYFYPTKAN